MELTLNRETFITSYPHYNVLNKKHTELLWHKRPIHLYIHLPFCPKRCDYCYYRVEAGKKKSEIDAYVNALLQEIERLGKQPELQCCTVKTLYFGGGTPTMLSSEHFVLIAEALKRSFTFVSDYEFCVEVRPGREATEEKLQTLKKLGVNRISMGSQSLDEEVLKMNGRNHILKLFYETYDRLRSVGFDWINVDILSGLLHELEETWKNTIQTLAGLRPENISIYKLEVFYNTTLFQLLKKRPELMISDDVEARRFKWARNWLENEGYYMFNSTMFTTDDQYIHEQRRAVHYGEEMLGIGLSSHSYFNGFLFQNTSDMKEYHEWIEEGKNPILRAYKLSAREEIIRSIVFGLKNLSLSRNAFYQRFGFDIKALFADKINDLEAKGILEVTDNHINIAFDYYEFADDVSRFFYPDEQKEDMLAHLSRKG